jgi:hypothetical protein
MYGREKNSQTLQWNIRSYFRQTLNICLKNFQENGSVGRKPPSGRLKKRDIYHNNLVCLLVPVMIVRKDLHLFPYRLTSVQELHPAHFPQRLEYCQCPIFFESNNN